MIYTDYWKFELFGDGKYGLFFRQNFDRKMIFTWSFWAFCDIPGPGKYGFLRSVTTPKITSFLPTSLPKIDKLTPSNAIPVTVIYILTLNAICCYIRCTKQTVFTLAKTKLLNCNPIVWSKYLMIWARLRNEASLLLNIPFDFQSEKPYMLSSMYLFIIYRTRCWLIDRHILKPVTTKTLFAKKITKIECFYFFYFFFTSNSTFLNSSKIIICW